MKASGVIDKTVMVFGQIEFKAAGTHFIEVLVDDVMKLRYPIPVVLAPPPEQSQKSSTPAENAPGA